MQQLIIRNKILSIKKVYLIHFCYYYDVTSKDPPPLPSKITRRVAIVITERSYLDKHIDEHRCKIISRWCRPLVCQSQQVHDGLCAVQHATHLVTRSLARAQYRDLCLRARPRALVLESLSTIKVNISTEVTRRSQSTYLGNPQVLVVQSDDLR